MQSGHKVKHISSEYSHQLPEIQRRNSLLPVYNSQEDEFEDEQEEHLRFQEKKFTDYKQTI